MEDYDVCIIGSGAGAGPIAYELSKSGYSVVVLEKGPWFTEQDFLKDEINCCRRSVYTPNLKDERHVIEDLNDETSGRLGPLSIPDGISGMEIWLVVHPI
jgi:choline dehydrogenase-like flavoprotein